MIHWVLCQNFNLPHTGKLYEHTPQPVIESTEVTTSWDCTINTDRKREANRTEITIKNFEENTFIMIDVTVSGDKNISGKDFQKLSKYKDLEIEVTKIWKRKTKTIPVATGSLGMIKKGTQNFYRSNPWKTITAGNPENSTHKYCSHFTKSALSLSKHTVISSKTITSKHSLPLPSSQIVSHATLHLPPVSCERLGR